MFSVRFDCVCMQVNRAQCLRKMCSVLFTLFDYYFVMNIVMLMRVVFCLLWFFLFSLSSMLVSFSFVQFLQYGNHKVHTLIAINEHVENNRVREYGSRNSTMKYSTKTIVIKSLKQLLCVCAAFFLFNYSFLMWAFFSFFHSFLLSFSVCGAQWNTFDLFGAFNSDSVCLPKTHFMLPARILLLFFYWFYWSSDLIWFNLTWFTYALALIKDFIWIEIQFCRTNKMSKRVVWCGATLCRQIPRAIISISPTNAALLTAPFKFGFELSSIQIRKLDAMIPFRCRQCHVAPIL